jgi:hypothetical protein
MISVYGSIFSLLSYSNKLRVFIFQLRRQVVSGDGTAGEKDDIQKLVPTLKSGLTDSENLF